MAFPSHAKYLVIGAGIHGLSTAFHLAQELKNRGRGSGGGIPPVSQNTLGAGGAGGSCGGAGGGAEWGGRGGCFGGAPTL